MGKETGNGMGLCKEICHRAVDTAEHLSARTELSPKPGNSDDGFSRTCSVRSVV